MSVIVGEVEQGESTADVVTWIPWESDGNAIAEYEIVQLLKPGVYSMSEDGGGSRSHTVFACDTAAIKKKRKRIAERFATIMT